MPFAEGIADARRRREGLIARDQVGPFLVLLVSFVGFLSFLMLFLKGVYYFPSRMTAGNAVSGAGDIHWCGKDLDLLSMVLAE